jgi:hypothetical protein
LFFADWWPIPLRTASTVNNFVLPYPRTVSGFCRVSRKVDSEFWGLR